MPSPREPNPLSPSPGVRGEERARTAGTVAPPYLRVVRREGIRREAVREHWARRALNIAVALVGMAITAPLWIVIGALVKLTSRGPIFHTQIRVGRDSRNTGFWKEDPRRRHDMGGRPFTIYKFRTMYVEAEQKTGAIWATKDDPRVTVLGRFLRQYRLDELPQLLNVVLGDMNIVGPRPERPSIFETLRGSVQDYSLRQRARPGITGLAQVSQQYDSCLADVQRKVEYDLEYIRRAGFWQDLRIMVRTIPVILLRRGGW
ncbi:MAG: sugar transferase [Gemmatimonadales bacterium]